MHSFSAILVVVRVSPKNKVRAVEHVQVLRTFRRPDLRLDLTLPHQQFLRPLRELPACLSRAKLLL